MSKTICFYNAVEILPEHGGVERVTWVLASFFEKNGYSVLFLSKSEKSELVNPDNRQFFIPLRNKRKFKEFIAEHKIEIFVNQDGAAKFPYPISRNRKFIFITVLHLRPFFFNEDSPFEKISRLPVLRSFPKSILKKIISCRLFNNAFLELFKIILGFRYRKTIKMSDAFVVLSEAYISEIKSIVGNKISTTNIRTIHNPVPILAPDVDFSLKKKEVLWIGRLVFSQKRPDLMLKIWALIQERFPDWSLRFLGDGEYSAELKKEAQKLSRVFFEGRTDPRKYYEEASILCMTSAYEGFPMVLLEGAVNGCVPVAFDSFAALRDIVVDEENGRVVEWADCEAYAETLCRLMEDTESRIRLGTASLKRVNERFALEVIGTKWMKLFGELAPEKLR
ncbi:MAG: glycosyltransferase [Candidatus Spyradosoma sp.]